jgi:hypothetical protein
MRKSSALAAAACLLQLACVSQEARRVSLGIPGYTPLKPDDFGEVHIADFRSETPAGEFDAAKEFVEYMAVALARRFEGRVVRTPVPADKAGRSEDREFWAGLPVGAKPTLFLTGAVSYTEEVRKALFLDDEKAIDGPFRREPKGLSERRIYTITIDIALIRGGTGEIVLAKRFKESSTYPDPNVPYGYAFHELAPHIRQRFLQTVFGDSRLQERFLFTR